MCALFSQTIADNSSPQYPSETIVLKLPDSTRKDWKEAGKFCTQEMALALLIPINQTPENETESITIQYLMDWKDIKSIEDAVDIIGESILSLYPKNTTTWKILEKNKTDIIYEWIVHKPYEHFPVQHEISRVFLTEQGFHRISFTHKHSVMSSAEKAKWVKSLRELSSVVSAKEAAAATQGISIMNLQ